MRVYRGFGAAGYDTGRDCPVSAVPNDIEFAGIKIPSPAGIDAWCDCMYANRVVNAACKQKVNLDIEKIFDKGGFFDTLKFGPSPWTMPGKAVRALPGSPEWLSTGLNKLADAAAGAVRQAGTGSGTTTGGSLPTPAGADGPLATSTTPSTGSGMRLATLLPAEDLARLQKAQERARETGIRVNAVRIDKIVADMNREQKSSGSAMPLLAAGIAAFLLLK